MYKFKPNEFENFEFGDSRNWVLGNGLGGYSSQSIINSFHRKHFGYLIASLNPPVSRYMILSRTNELVYTNNHVYDLESQLFDTYKKEGYKYLTEFTFDSTPVYTYEVEGVKITKEIAIEYGKNTVGILYVVKNNNSHSKLVINPLFNFRDHGERCLVDELKYDVTYQKNKVVLIPESNKNVKIKFLYSEGICNINENKYIENCLPYYDYSTGDDRLDNHYNEFNVTVDLNPSEEKRISIVVTIEKTSSKNAFSIIERYKNRMNKLVKNSGITDELGIDLVKASDHFICNRNSTGLKTILAGLPWFTDWGRDTMIAFTGLVLVPRRFEDAREILLSFSKYEKNGLIPNMFPDDNNAPLYNTVDASLWYFYAVHKYIEYTGDYDFIVKNLLPTLKNIVKAYSTKTDFSIFMDKDYLVSSGSHLDQVTWMDVRVGEVVVTPRHGKVVEINALWYNALIIIADLCKYNKEDGSHYLELAEKVKKSFNERFFCEETNCLYDVLDENDNSVRPNQIWVLSLPYKVLDKSKEKSVLEVCEKELFNRFGLRSLTYKDPRFKPKYEGKLWDRDMAYHMGTTWGFLIGGFFDAYCYVNDYSVEAKNTVNKWAHDFIEHLNEGCINGIAEIFDGLEAYRTRGCYTQAWSIGELLRSYYENILKK